MLQRLTEYLHTRRLFFKVLSARRIFRWFPDKLAIKILWKNSFEESIDLDNPRRFNEKLQWLKLNFRKPVMTTIVDKYEVKSYVANLIGEEHVIPTLSVFDNVEQINVDELPNQFVMKTTAGGGGKQVFCCRDKRTCDFEQILRDFKQNLRKNAYYPGREWPYRNVRNRILIERLIGDKEIEDFKFFCFNGDPKFFKIDFNRNSGHRANYYNLNGDILSLGEYICPPDLTKHHELPKNFDKMIEICRKLSKSFPFVRVDLYNLDGKIYFGEMTFYPASGFGRYTIDEWDFKIGDMLTLPL